ncbi:SUMF1/EgtB/PvdO family nonheme iron enzyme [Stieleria varia]|uniref:SUMF1/EgtB/PvdO family nonheme iron enzyme n=1 Tax=Stieleria varia TaxID=2528005 RepID=UPI0018D236FA|nr:SUMF1/EgtB/PvdO family nonheme iron enzyme [Stieleria varia]
MIQPNQFVMGGSDSRAFAKDHSDFNSAGDDQPSHPVILTRPFYMATTEVTVGQFKRFVQATGYETQAQSSGNGIVGWMPIDGDRPERPKQSFAQAAEFDWLSPGFPQTDDCPVVGVSYNDAMAYCEWISQQENAEYRLPTEAEWECVCRAGTDTLFSFGDDYPGQIHRHANLGNAELEKSFPGRVTQQWLVDTESDPGDGQVFTAPVGNYTANAWGLHDLHGNVWEWCQDNYLDTFYTQFKSNGYRSVQPRAIDPVCTERWQQDGDWRVIRGGSWFVSPIQCQSSMRGYFEASDAACYVGFRVVRQASEAARGAAEQRHAASVAADEQLRSIARATVEAHQGVIRYEIDCDAFGSDAQERIGDLMHPVEFDIRPPGKITTEMIESVCRAQKLAGIIIRSGGDDITSQTFAPLANHPGLRWIQITGTVDLDDTLLDHFRNADQIESLHLQGEGITNAGLEKLPPLKTLREVILASTACTGEFLRHHVGSPLTQLHIQRLTDSAARTLTQFPEMRQLHVSSPLISPSGLQDIASLRLLNQLSLRDISTLSDSDFATLGRLRQLERLELFETKAGDQTVAACNGLNQLRTLVIDGDALTDNGLQTIADIPSLHELYIRGNSQITDQGLQSLWRLPNLRQLELRGTAITGTGLAALCELPKLRDLQIDGDGLSDAGRQVVTQLQESCPELRIRTR